MSRQLELRHLRAFVVVAEELHFTRAAQRLHIAQQALSGQISQMEEGLGTQLFVRTTRKVELTEAGRVLLAHAVSILEALTTAWEETERAGRGEGGRVAICYAPTAEQELIPALVGALRRRYPSMRVHASVMWQAEAIEAVRSTRFDMGLSRCPADLGPGVECEPIQYHRLGVIVGAKHPVAPHDEIRLKALSAESVVIWPREFSPGYYDWIVDALRTRGFVGTVREFEHSGVGMLMSDAAAREEVHAGRAFGIGYRHQYAPLPSGLVWRPIAPTAMVPMHMFWKRNASRSIHNVVTVARELAATEQWLAAAGSRAARNPDEEHAEPITQP
jgi:DNA-binding transcriptional LysR family regulator